jgi:hypothetical protein
MNLPLPKNRKIVFFRLRGHVNLEDTYMWITTIWKEIWMLPGKI